MQRTFLESLGVSAEQVPRSCNAHAARAHKLTRDWATSYGLLGDTRQQNLFDQLSYTQLLAYGCTTAPVDRLALFAQWFTYYFLLDDQQDLAVLTGRNKEFIVLQDDVRRILHTRGIGAPMHSKGLRAAVADLCRRTTQYVSDAWWHRYIDHAEQLFSAQRQESNYRLANCFPTPSDFKNIRRRASAVDMVFDIIQACEQAEISESLRSSAACCQYADDLNDFTTWSNDILGLDHDAANADPNNYVRVRQHADNLSLDAAIDAVTVEVAQLVSGFANRKKDVRVTACTFTAAQWGQAERALHAWYAWAMNVPVHYLKSNSRLFQMDQAAPKRPPAFTEDLLI